MRKERRFGIIVEADQKAIFEEKVYTAHDPKVTS
jgi:hypothetical protein